MFTVLYTDEKGNEAIYAAKEVLMRAVRPAHERNPLDCDPGVHIRLPDGGFIHYEFRGGVGADEQQPKVFVMNDAGSTVARYAL